MSRREPPPIPLVADSDLDGASRPSWFMTQEGLASARVGWSDTVVPADAALADPAPVLKAPGTTSARNEARPTFSGVASSTLDTRTDSVAPAVTTPHGRPGDTTFRRLFGAFVLARALLGTLLLLIQVVLMLYGSAQPPLLGMLGCGAYAVLTVLTWRSSLKAEPPVNASGYLRQRWLFGTVGVDLLMFTLLLLLVGGGLNVPAMYALPVLMAATLSTLRVALAASALSALALLLVAALQQIAGGEPSVLYTQAGLTGAGLFVMAMLTGEVASRLARQEQTTRTTMELARQQALLNRLVLEEMQEGVMVVDRSGHVRAANPAALELIGAPERPWATAFELQGVPNWEPLLQAVERAYQGWRWPEAGIDLPLRAGRDSAAAERHMRVRGRFTRRRSREVSEPLCVLFIEDIRIVQARARQEKLAAMGRISAGIAHEIRNPLAAIAQANQLLAEDLEQDPHLARLTRMVADNVERLRRIVDDVQAYAPAGPVRDAPLLDLTEQAVSICEDWARTAGLAVGPESVLYIRTDPERLRVRFDPEHLRRVLVNLLDNALRHGSRQPRAVWVQVSAYGSDGARLWVASDGDPIPADIEPYLFEPFFSTRSRGSGLGLYICRELCERHGASIEYRLRRPPARHRNSFVVTMPRWSSEPPTPAPHERAPRTPTPPAGRR